MLFDIILVHSRQLWHVQLIWCVVLDPCLDPPIRPQKARVCYSACLVSGLFKLIHPSNGELS